MTEKVSLPDQLTMYQALVDKNSAYEGVFVVGVKTTGICCRPTCNARKPKPENVEYFSNVKQALGFGYRPCKVCQPLKPFGEEPEWLKGLLQKMEQASSEKIKDQDLRELGLDPVRVRRWFKKHHGMTFQAFARATRINRAFGLIKHKEKVIDAAMDSGFESLSGFNDAFKRVTGNTPSNKHQAIITITRILTPLGPMFAGASDKGICLLEFTDRRMLETQIDRLTKLLSARFVPGSHPLFDLLDRQLKEYFAGQRTEFTVPLDCPGTEFQQKVWAQLQTIPHGKTRAYQEQAEAINNPKAVRAVAKANGDNRISILIPCHRVIGKNGQLTGYGGGIWRKQRLLELEQGNINWQSSL
ncbi:bifunctional transcriptional activator/DNA repair enzyme AdaA [Aliikangiella sp. G2MR2-5]|uniref:bifunctional transcriptional activator/DNA repair enzyme AdaA n=1 Tax=Aliikangiella sp. G2MR2-5 TaxID=2788943 RepID=UPI0018AC518B|nr:methylated-DNA--[protein]-cysteine S-methyltransferase [Aliikangiella sp. G2MR2-5]